MSFGIGPFAVEDCLGRGAMASVWAGFHRESGQPVAVKLMHADLARRPWYRRSFEAEVRAVARLEHPNIVTILDHGIVNEEDAKGIPSVATKICAGSAWLAMERLDGPSLRQHRGSAPWTALVQWLDDLLAGLGHAHARGLLHRDLKPANVLLRGGRAVLVDFGLVREFHGEPEDTHDGVIAGTTAFMAPEQFDGDEAAYGPWTDLYALGCLVWFLVAGHAPFGHNRPRAELAFDHRATPPPRWKRLGGTPPGLEAWLLRLLEKNPLDRYQFAADAREGLKRVCSEPVWGGHVQVAMPVCLPEFPPQWPGQAQAPSRPPGLMGAGIRLFGLRQPRLVGRNAIQRRLWDALRSVHHQAARAIVLQGPAGAGKTHIVRWLGEAAHACGAATVVYARHGKEPSRGDGLVAALRRTLGVVGENSVQIRQRIESLAKRWELDAAQIADLHALIPTGSGPHRSLLGDEKNGLVTELLGWMGRVRPVVLCLDDVHWGPDTLEFVAQLVRRPPPLRPRVLVLMTARSVARASPIRELLDAVLAEPRTETVPVELLSPGFRPALIQSLMPVERELAQRLEARAGGNPLFTMQLLGDWVERGLLVPGASGLVLRDGADAALPANLHEVWQLRLERALRARPMGERWAVELAAILGTHVDRREWHDACLMGGVQATPHLLDALLTAGLAQPDSLGREPGWSFVHGHLRESLLLAAKEGGRTDRWHLACAEMLQTRSETDPSVDLRLGHHRLAMGDPEGALAPLWRGAWEAMRASEYLRAERGLDDRQKALDALGAPQVDPRRAEGWLMRARLARRRGDRVRAEQVAWALLSVTRDPAAQNGPEVARWTGLSSQAHREAARLSQLKGNPSAAMDHARAALALARQRGDGEALAWCRRDYGLLRVRAGARLSEVDGILAAAQATFEQVDEQFGVADCLWARALVRHRELRPSDAAPLLRAARRALRRCLRLQEPAHSQVSLAAVAHLSGRLAEAVRWYRAAQDRFVHIGLRGPLRLPWWTASVCLDRGDAAAARGAIAGHASDLPALDSIIRSHIALLDGDVEGAVALVPVAGTAKDPELVERAERLARAARAVAAHRLMEAAGALAMHGWGHLGWPLRARRMGRLLAGG